MTRILTLIAAPAALTLLGGCVQPSPVSHDTCGTSAWVGMVGQPVSALQAAGLPTTARIVRPGQAMTMEFSPDRLNVGLDQRDMVSSVYCG